jgi:hypothetical protein
MKRVFSQDHLMLLQVRVLNLYVQATLCVMSNNVMIDESILHNTSFYDLH